MFIQKLRRKIKNRFIKKSLRSIKGGYFFLLNLLGTVIFFVGRLLRAVPEIEKFSVDKVDKILVVRLDRVGDVVCSLPTVRALRNKFPNSFIALLVAPYTEDLVAENKDINEAIVYNSRWSILDKIRFIKKLAENKFDLVAVLDPFFKSAFMAYLSKARFRIGYPVNGTGFLLTHKVDLRNRYKHEIETCLDVARLIGVEAEGKRPPLLVSLDAERYAEDFFNQQGILPSDIIIGIHLGGYEEHTHWLLDRYAQVADILISRYRAKVILLGSQIDKKIIEDMVSLMSYKPILTDLNNSLQILMAVIKKCDIFLGNCSGPMHIAAALGVPVVVIFGDIHPLGSENKWAPLGPHCLIVRKAMDCVDCHPGHCRDYKCMKLVTVEDVMSAMETQIARLNK